MRRLILAVAAAAMALASFSAAADAKCAICPTGTSVQTPDGQPWSDGKPVTVVVAAKRLVPTVEFPARGLAVVMNTDGDRTKCLDVPLKLVSSTGDGAIYAGVFYPFRVARYDGKLSLGDETFDIAFDVGLINTSASAASAPELPIGSTEEPYGFVFPAIGGLPLAAIALAFWGGLATYLYRRQPRLGIAR